MNPSNSKSNSPKNSLIMVFFSLMKPKNFRLLLYLFTILAIANLLGGCFFFKTTTSSYPTKSQVMHQVALNKTFVIHDGLNQGNTAFYSSDIEFKDDSIVGRYLTDYVMPFKKTAFPKVNSSQRYRKSRGEARLLNEVHIYLPVGTNSEGVPFLNFVDENSFSFSQSNIIRLDIYNPNTAATVFSWTISILGGLMILPYLFIGFLVLFGASCPYIYVNTANGYELAGEIYSGAISAPMERHDYLSLPALIDEDGKYLLKITNELEEVQHTNLMELIAIDHPDEFEVMIDKYGEYHSLSGYLQASKITNLEGKDISRLLGVKDSLQYAGPDLREDPPVKDGVIMTYDLPPGINSGKLVVRAKNSLWLEYVFQNMRELFGGNYNEWAAKQDGIKKIDLKQWSLDQKIPLSVYVEKNGEWIAADYFNLAGPLALKDDILEISFNSESESDQVIRIKLEAGAYFWEFDFVGLDISPDIQFNVEKLSVNKALTQDETDISESLRWDDLKYYVQAELYDMADIEFIAAELTDESRTLILHTKGHYIMKNNSRAVPRLSEVRKFRDSGYFLEYSRDRVLNIINEFGISNDK